MAAALAETGLKVMQIGCDPKADSTINLLGGEPLRPVMNYMREEDEEPDYIDEIVEEEVEELYEEDIWISPNMIFTCEEMPKLQIAAEICEDLWVPNPPSVAHAYHGANLIVNLFASDEVDG